VFGGVLDAGVDAGHDEVIEVWPMGLMLKLNFLFEGAN
jgi:hypothetical protein